MFNDIKYMRRCIQLARCGEAGAPPNPMVGAVIVCGGRIIGEGYHRRCGGPHAEVNAINSVRDKNMLKRSTIYVSLEPCAHFGKTPPCADLIICTGIPRVVIGCADPFAKVNGLGIKKLREAGREVVVGVLDEECRELNRRFFTFHQEHRPWITLKWAQSKDGFIGASPFPSQGGVTSSGTTPSPLERAGVRLFFSNALTQTLVHRLRARSGAILVGTGTALADNPTLTTRYWQGPNPLRLTIDRHGSLPPTLHLLDGSTPTIVYTHETINEILADLFERGIQSLLVEGGAKLLQSFIDAGLWDEARIETAPSCLGQGLAAPSLTHKQLQSQKDYGGHTIQYYRHRP
ncbi:MAG: bifunctional diaminohydroxyphosphoribosylaminopyrimidine deaminase/5-amino-6-(5-phosphoribosylamino)uracil reductase RibD [Bacteroidaceae bacterium]|nr:bifunctional diaminohydroxyphosphoribosylaminopyrimidine deaminase/5-amino-6-(5-phosphoribosylamino)uracil reductase RibD [Bacteroidaceae bacterium]